MSGNLVGIFRHGFAYEIDQQNLPANAPPDLKTVRKAIVKLLLFPVIQLIYMHISAISPQ
jgi:hypothetical protein